jgi:ABC-type nitrate/sulfonate/bicarbonate transport system substrate-binding protein
MIPVGNARFVGGRRRAALALGALALASGVAATLWNTRTKAPAPALRIALASTPHAALLHLAAAKDYFRDEGLNVTLVPVSHGKAALELLAKSEVDLAAAAEVPFVIEVLRGAALSIAASMLSVSTEMAIVARRDRGISAPASLVGKRVGATVGTSGDYFLWAFLIRHKLAPGDVSLVDLPPGRLAQELAIGTIDAASTWQPVRFQAETALGAEGISFVEPKAYTVTHVVVGRTDFVRAQAEPMRRLVRGLLRAEEFVKAQPQEAAALASQLLRVDLSALQRNWSELGFRVNLLQSQLVTLEDEARWAMTRGYIAPREVPNFISHLYLDALLGEQPDRVTVVH